MSDARPVHLLVLIHGMWGNPGHLAELARIIRETKKKNPGDIDFEVLVASKNSEESTYDGIDWGAERVVQEFLAKVELLASEGRKVTKLSVTGYSLGGLIARYFIGILHQRKFFDTVTPVNFNTFATPHIGLPRYPGWISQLAGRLGPHLLSRTGKQFYARDQWSDTRRPLLDILSDPDMIFYQALSLFPHITFYVNAVNDLTVPYITGGIELEDPFLNQDTTGLEVEFEESYKPLVKSWRFPDTPPTKAKAARPFSKAWLKKVRDAPNPGPPQLQFRFPGNIVMFALSPLLFVTFIPLVICRLALSSRRSKKRIALLEADESAADALVRVVMAMEKRMEDAVAEAVDTLGNASAAPGTPPSVSPASGSQGTLAGSTAGKVEDEEEAGSAKTGGAFRADLLPAQRKMVERLNALPNLSKRLVYIHPTRNSHATIVARDVKNFDYHRLGWGVIQHWADNLVV